MTQIIAQSGKRITVEECKHDWGQELELGSVPLRKLYVTCNCCHGSGEHNTGSGPGREDYQCWACLGHGHFRATYGDGSAVVD